MTMFDHLTDDELLQVAKHHQAKFDAAWRVVMATHYRSGRYIDSHDTMEREYIVLGTIGRYIYANRDNSLYKDYLKLNTGIATTSAL